MGKKVLVAFFGGLFGFFVGSICGGFLGLVIGRTFFGWLELSNYPYMPGYELAVYIGIVLGVLLATPLGVIIALSITIEQEVKFIKVAPVYSIFIGIAIIAMWLVFILVVTFPK